MAPHTLSTLVRAREPVIIQCRHLLRTCETVCGRLRGLLAAVLTVLLGSLGQALHLSAELSCPQGIIHCPVSSHVSSTCAKVFPCVRRQDCELLQLPAPVQLHTGRQQLHR